MPYTPPSHHSPASTISLSPTSTPHHGHRRPPPRSPSGSGPSLPRSRSSSAASRKRQEDDTLKNTEANRPKEGDHKHEQRLNIDTSVRRSPPPVTNSVMPAGAIISPPDSGHASSDEETSSKPKNQDEKDIKELEEAVRSMQINRKGSPDPNETFKFPVPVDGGEPNPEKAAKLTETARKIAHSRSTTDTAIVFTPAIQPADSPANASISDGSEDDMEKPPLIRKKSGELVKPAIRPKARRTASSMPGTPTYGKKGVHFNDDIQQVRHFLQVDRPIAVSAGGSPVEAFEDEREFPFGRQPPSPTLAGCDIRLGNFPRESLERQSQPVRLEKLAMSADQRSLLGSVIVANLAFSKTVVARFTTDFWRTTSEVLGEYCSDPLQKPQAGCDLFTFSVKLSDVTNIEKKTMFMCVRYLVNGQEYWDNNNSMNYQVDFIKKQATAASAPGLASRPIPRSRKSSTGPGRMRHQPSFDEDFSNHFESRPAFKLDQPSQDADLPKARPANRSSQQFSNRYDFGASLTAALTQAQSTLGDRSGARKPQTSQPSVQTSLPPVSSITQRQTPLTSTRNETPRPDTLYANKSSLDSRAYQEFVSKFCFFGSGKPQANGTSHDTSASQHQKQPPASGTDGAQDDKPPVPAKAPERSSLHDENGMRKPPLLDEPTGATASPQLRAGSPSFSPTYGASTRYGSRSSSPASLGYRFGPSIDYGLLSSGSTTPATAIHG